MSTRRGFLKTAIAAAAAAATGSALAKEQSDNPFGFKKLDQGYQNNQLAEGKCGEGKCGGNAKPKAAEGKCGEGKCCGNAKPNAGSGSTY
jgi:uncharacterized low-complexity protein